MRHSEGSFQAFDGETIHHQTWAPESTARALIVLVHGLGEHSGRYAHVAGALVDAGFVVAALDQRGHGRSTGKRVFVKSYDEFMRDLTQFRRLAEVEHPDLPVVMLGHSMGGNLVMGHILGNQAGLAGVVLSGPALQIGDDVSSVQRRVLSVVARIAPGLRPEGLDAEAISRDPAVVDAYLNDPLVYTGKVSAGLAAALIGASHSFPDRYDQLRVPMLLLHGTGDRLCDVRGTMALEAAAVNADVTSHYYDGLYHEVFNEPEQDRVLADVVAWLDHVIT